MTYTVTRERESSKAYRLHNEKGALDLGSIMVGIIALGIIGGVVAATVFAVIPWSQDNAAKAQLKNVTEAQEVYYASSHDGHFAPYETLVRETDTNAQGNPTNTTHIITASTGVATLDGVSRPLTITLNADKSCYVSVIQSASGKFFSVTNTHTNPEVFERGTSPGCVDPDVLEREVAESVDETPIAEPEPEAPETPTPKDPALMVSTWDISTTKTIQLPVQGSIGEGSTIDWGDGTVEPLTVDPSHTYNSGTAATVTIDGSFTEWSMGRIGYGSYASGPQLRTITQWDDEVGTTSLVSGFTKATNLTLVKEIPSTVTTLQRVFADNRTFNGDISGWDTSNVTDMSNMFYNAYAFNQPVEFNTSNVTNMNNMFSGFSGANAFNQPVNFDTRNVTNMSGMFQNAHEFNQPVNFDTSQVTEMQAMFGGAQAFNQPVNFDTRNVTKMNSMFAGARVFNQPVNFDTSKVWEMSGMFSSASEFNSPVTFTDTSKVMYMRNMFSGASVFNQPVNFNTRNVADMNSMFQAAQAFNQPVNFDTTAARDMSHMFRSATSFNQPVRFNTAVAVYMESMFRNASVFNQPVNFNTSGVTNMESMFHHAWVFNQPVNFDTRNVTKMGWMFSGTSMFNQPLNFDTRKVTDMINMFKDARAFNQNISQWNVSNVTRWKTDWDGFRDNSPLSDENTPAKFR